MKEFLQGNIAASYGAIDGGIDFFAGYPITPSSEILETFSRELPKLGKVFYKWRMNYLRFVLLLDLL